MTADKRGLSPLNEIFPVAKIDPPETQRVT